VGSPTDSFDIPKEMYKKMRHSTKGIEKKIMSQVKNISH